MNADHPLNFMLFIMEIETENTKGKEVVSPGEKGKEVMSALDKGKEVLPPLDDDVLVEEPPVASVGTTGITMRRLDQPTSVR